MKGLSINLYQYINVAICYKMWTIQDWLGIYVLHAKGQIGIINAIIFKPLLTKSKEKESNWFRF